jgi:hypothetical protein
MVEVLAGLLEFNPYNIPARTICRGLLTSLQAAVYTADQQ